MVLHFVFCTDKTNGIQRKNLCALVVRIRMYSNYSYSFVWHSDSNSGEISALDALKSETTRWCACLFTL